MASTRPTGLTRTSSRTNPSNRQPSRARGGLDFGGTTDTKLSEDTITSLSLLGKVLSQTNASQLKKLTEDELVTRKREEVLQKKTLETLNELITNLSDKTGSKKEEIVDQLQKKKGPLYDLLIKDEENNELLNKVSNSLQTQNVGQTLKEMKTDTEKHLEYRKKVTIEERENLKQFWSERLEKLNKSLMKHEDQVKNSLLGPLTLLISPIEEFVGGSLFQGIKGFFDKRKEKKAKRNPGENDLVKHDDVAMLFLWHKIKHFFKGGEDEDGKKSKGLLGDLLGGLLGTGGIKGMMSKIGPALLKALPILAIVAGLIWSVLDGLAGVKMANKWGTSKFSAFLGGFLGGTGKGWSGAFKNAGKGALIGFGVGMLVFGPIGGLVGALLGGLIWGVLGYIGGEKIAKGIQGLGKWISNIWNSGFVQDIVGFVTSVAGDVVTYYKDNFKNVGDLIGGKKTFGQFLTDFVNIQFKFLGNLANDYLDKYPIGQLIKRYLINPIEGFFNMIGDFFKYLNSFSLKDIIAGKADPFGLGEKVFHDKSVEERREQEKKRMVFSFNKDLDKSEMWAKAQASGGIEESRFIDSKYKELEDSGKVDKGYITSINDAIIRPDGKIIRTDVDDTIIATKNTPSLNPGNSGLVEAKLDKMILLLQQLLAKDITINMPPATTHDLDMLIGGLI